MACITAVLALIGIYIPFSMLFVFFIWIIPVVLVVVRHDLTTGILSVIVSGLLVLFFSGPVLALVSVLQFGGLALALGYGFQKKWEPGLTLLLGIVVSVISTLLLFYLTFLITGINQLDITAMLTDSIEPTIQMMKNIGYLKLYNLGEDQAREMFVATVQLVSFIFQATLALNSALLAVINYVVAQKILVRFKIEIRKLPPFREWRLPWPAVWGLIAGLGIQLLGSYLNVKLVTMIGFNIIALYVGVLFFLGLSVINFYIYYRLNNAGIYRFLLFILIIFLGLYALGVIVILGLTDMLFNFRRLAGEN